MTKESCLVALRVAGLRPFAASPRGSAVREKSRIFRYFARVGIWRVLAAFTQTYAAPRGASFASDASRACGGARSAGARCADGRAAWVSCATPSWGPTYYRTSYWRAGSTDRSRWRRVSAPALPRPRHLIHFARLHLALDQAREVAPILIDVFLRLEVSDHALDEVL